jgi:hypothetical protein
VLEELRNLAMQRPTYGYRRLWALLRRQRRVQGLSPVNAKRVYRLAKVHKFLLQRYTGSPPLRVHEGTVAVEHSDQRYWPYAEPHVRWCGRGVSVSSPPTRLRAHMKKSGSQESQPSPSKLIDARIKELGDWRGKMLSRLRTLVKEADPEVVEEWKWRGVPVWSHDGIICTGETYKSVVKMTFAKGAALKDPSRLFNSSLEGNTRRAIDFHEGEELNEQALKTLIRAAVTLNKARVRS